MNIKPHSLYYYFKNLWLHNENYSFKSPKFLFIAHTCFLNKNYFSFSIKLGV